MRSLTNRSSSAMSDSEAPQYKVFVGGLTWDLTNEELVSGEAGRALAGGLCRSVLTNRHRPDPHLCWAWCLPGCPAGCSAEFKDYNASKAEILVDKMSGRSRGFGFVWFDK